MSEEKAKTEISLWSNDSKNAKAPPLTGTMSCPCCEANLRVALWAREQDPSGKRPRLSGEVEAASGSSSEATAEKKSGDEVVDDLFPKHPTTKGYERKITKDQIPF
jgi:hypothetical protein